MKTQVSNTIFANELSDLISGLDSFRELITTTRSVPYAHNPPPATRRGMLAIATAQSSAAREADRREPARCPQSITRLCSSASSRRSISNAVLRTTEADVEASSIQPTAVAPLLVSRNKTSYEVTILTEEILSAPGWELNGDVITTWTKLFGPVSAFRIVSGARRFRRLRDYLHALPEQVVSSCIDAWLTAMLVKHIKPWDQDKADDIRSDVKFRYEWTEMYIRLRPMRNNSTRSCSPDSTRPQLLPGGTPLAQILEPRKYPSGRKTNV